MLSTIAEVFDWFGVDEQGRSRRLPLQDFLLGSERSIEVLKLLDDIATVLRDSPKVISDMIRERNWRPSVLGSAIAVRLKDRRFIPDLIWRLSEGTFVAPQVAIAIVLLHDTSTAALLQPLIDSANERSSPSTVLAAYCALRRIDSNSIEILDKSHTIEVLKSRENDRKIELFEIYWNNWRQLKNNE